MKKLIIYEISMAFLAIIAVVLALVDLSNGLNQWETSLDSAILVIFIIDYVVRFGMAKNKKVFLKENVLDLIAIIPFNSFFRIFRVAKLARLFRLLALTGRLFKRCGIFFNTNGFKYMLIVASFLILLGGFLIHYTEGMPLADGMWWAFVTATTVGYGDLSPSTPLGRIIAVILMIVGIGLIGSLTSTITSFFLNASKSHEIETFDHIIISDIQSQISNYKSLTDEEIDTICKVLKSINK